MAVPAHDKRDFEFAKKFNLPIRKVIEGGQKEGECYEGEGILINSEEFSGLSSKEAKEKMAKWLKERKIGGKKVYYKIRDWVFARQRYWGEPFPLVFCENCKKRILEGKYKKGEFNKGELLNPGWVCVPEKDLPVKLPRVKYYEPTGTGESPLAKIEKWVNTRCPKCGGPAKRETNTMPQWAGSCWYYLRYIDPKNKKELISKKKEKYWMPVDLYVGGAEHATRHLIYARFWHKFLYDIGVVSTKEPFLRLKSVGVILGPDGRKMSKRYGNIVNPDNICKKFGADSLRVYEMFMGPFDQEIAWQERGVVGARRFLERVWNLRLKIANCKLQIEKRKRVLKILHQTIKKVTEDIENFKFNTAISQLMICANELEKEEKIEKEIFENFLKLLAPFAPHIAEEIWQILGHKKSIFLSPWPKWDERLAKEEMITLVIQVNGKVRDKIEVEANISEERAKELTLSREKIKKWIEGKEIKKIVFVPGKLINIVI
jgi:leucyl-tRNA synthetase